MRLLIDALTALFIWAQPFTYPELSASQRGLWACWRSVRMGFEKSFRLDVLRRTR